MGPESQLTNKEQGVHLEVTWMTILGPRFVELIFRRYCKPPMLQRWILEDLTENVIIGLTIAL